MFRGINAVNIDSKGRLAVPTKYRDSLVQDCAGRVVMTIDTDATCLLLYPMPEWEVIERKIQALPSFNAQARRVQRLLIGHATDMELDNTGRLLVPPLLRDYAGFDKRVMLVGQGKKFELWDEAQWHANRTKWLALGSDLNADELPQELQNLAL